MPSNRVLVVTCVLLLVTMGYSASIAGAESSDTGSFVEAEFTNEVPVEQTDGSTFVWKSEPNTLNVTFNATNESNIYKLCVKNEQGERVNCRDVSADPGNKTVSLEYENLTAFESSSNVTVVLWNNYPGQSEKIGSDTVNITVIEKTGDFDGDKLQNKAELQNNASLVLMDTDKDSLQDGAEVKNYGTSPTDTDTDHDNLSDAAELSKSLSPVDSDTDNDGIPDGVEVKLNLAPKDASADTDGDGLTDSFEYKHGSDPTDTDTDGDGLNDKLEVELGTNVDDGSTTVMLMTAGGTLFGVTLVGGRWYINSIDRDFDETVLSWFSLSKISHESATTDADTDHDQDELSAPETTLPLDFDQDELHRSSKPALTDEDKVIQLLREDDGWVYQSKIVENTDWSKSKVSRLLSRMADDEKIEKISVGRQNVVAEEGSMPDGFGHPFDE